jgi:hypothetical protein
MDEYISMNAKLYLVAGAAAAIFVGCGTPIPPGAERGPNGTMAYDVLIEASEPGARVEANGANIGNTPVHLKIFGDPDGTFHDFGSYSYVIRAFPLTTNQYEQVQVFSTGHMLTPEDRIPPRIYFDMNQKQPVYPAYAPPPDYYYAPPPPYYYGDPYFYGPSFRFYFGPPHHHWRR